MQIIRDTLLRNLAGILDLELLLQRQAGFGLSNRDHRTLHKGVHHPVLDRLGATSRASVEEQNGALLGAVVGVLVPVEGEARFRGRDGVDKVSDVAWCW